MPDIICPSCGQCTMNVKETPFVIVRTCPECGYKTVIPKEEQ